MLLTRIFPPCADFYQNFEQETDRIEPGLDSTKSLVKYEATLNVLRLEAHLNSILGYIARLKVALTRIDQELWPEDKLQNDLESLMARLNEVPCRVQAWKKSTPRCGADVVLLIVRVHSKDAKE